MASSYIIDPILPARELSIIAGPSGCGKSTWMIQHAHHISQGVPILNYPCRPVEWVHVSCDRSAEGMERTLDRIALPVDRKRFFSLNDIPSQISGVRANIEDIIRWSDCDLIFIEAFSLLMPTGKQHRMYQDTGSWLWSIGNACQKYNRTIVGTAHTPKMRDGDQILDKRQRVLGSVAFAAMVETIFVIERESHDELSNNRRLLHLLPRNAPEQTFYYELDKQGRFCESENPSEAVRTSVIEDIFKRLAQIFSLDQLEERCEASGVGRTTMYRWIRKAIADKRIRRAEHGIYEKITPS